MNYWMIATLMREEIQRLREVVYKGVTSQTVIIITCTKAIKQLHFEKMTELVSRRKTGETAVHR